MNVSRLPDRTPAGVGNTGTQMPQTPTQASRKHGLSRHQSVPWRGIGEPTSARCATCRGHGVLDRGFDEDAARDLIEECPDC